MLTDRSDFLFEAEFGIFGLEGLFVFVFDGFFQGDQLALAFIFEFLNSCVVVGSDSLDFAVLFGAEFADRLFLGGVVNRQNQIFGKINH